MDEVQERTKLLVIDDELGPRESIRFLFNTEYDVYCAESVDQGVAWLREESPDVIIMDIKMPGKTGIEGLREIRALDPLVAVVMLTGFGSLETAQEAIRHGANDYLKKPFDTREMRDTVRRYAELTRMARMRSQTFDQLHGINRQLQDELREKEHLASLGQASSELVHDLRNPLSVICGYVQLMLDDLSRHDPSQGNSSSSELLDYLQIIAKNAQRCQEMSQMWKDLGNPDVVLALSPCLVREIVDEVADSVQPQASRKEALVQVLPGPAFAMVSAHRVHLYRALQNVVTNAVQAVPPDTGCVTLTWHAGDGELAITVEDNGCGIPQESLRQVFSPYFTSKSASGGMGLGLFITKKVIEGHSGAIALENRPEGGATATIRLPLCPAE